MSLDLKNREMLSFSDVDVSPTKIETVQRLSDMPIQKMGKRDIEAYEKKNKIDLQNFISKQGFRLLVCILLAMFLMLIFDTIIINFGLSSSEHVETIIDFGKYTATTLLGFLFANQGNKD